MEITEAQIIGKFAKKCEQCSRKTLLPNDYEFTYVDCGYNVIERKHENSKT